MRNLRIVTILVLISCGWAGPPSAFGQEKPNIAGPPVIPAPPPIPGPSPPAIFVANGSGGGLELTQGIRKALDRACLKFWVETIPWSRFGSAPHDHADHIAQTAAAQDLASKVMAMRKQHPDRKIYLMAFSSGNRVVLDAAKHLPPNSVDRIILLAPSVVFVYDLGPALRASCEGIDSFYSSEDQVLEGVVSVLGTADGHYSPAAGRVGFWIPSAKSPSFPLYEKKLRQYPWRPSLIWTGHRGGHYGWVEANFLQAYVVPLLVRGH